MKRLFAFVFAILLVGFAPAFAQSPDDQYVQIYSLMQQADALNQRGQLPGALEKYLQAQSALQRLQRVFPEWNPKVVTFRLQYFENKIAGITSRSPALSSTNAATAGRAASTPGNESERRIAALEAEVRQLQNEKILLEAKLKEAFATQPAAIDPRELAKAEERIQSLMKENELLKLATAQAPAEGTDSAQKALEASQRALAEAAKNLSAQTERANALALEKDDLQKRLDALSSGSGDAERGKIQKALDAANKKLEEQIALANTLSAEKEALQSRVKELTAKADAAEALRQENQLLKKQVAELNARPAAQPDAQVQARYAALQSEAEVLRLERTTLQERLKEANAARAKDAQQIQQLERERDELKRKKAEPAQRRGFFWRRRSPDTSKNNELTEQVATLNARVKVLEAKPAPYSPEELALLNKPKTAVPISGGAAQPSPFKGPPPGTTSLAAEAQRLFAAKNYAAAEQRYLDILRQDENNVYTLANLAAIELEMGRLDEAEKNAKRAISIDPNDGYIHSIIGLIKFREQKYDEALNALSRAAELDPNSAKIQNYLGVALTHKGLREPAEAALRKAIVLDPTNGDAQNNLAVLYATQEPPLIGLARYHYQKALAAGQPHNPELEKLLEQKPATASAQ